jgi:hypothetical protein
VDDVNTTTIRPDCFGPFNEPVVLTGFFHCMGNALVFSVFGGRKAVVNMYNNEVGRDRIEGFHCTTSQQRTIAR